jgi:hypothetical protein
MAELSAFLELLTETSLELSSGLSPTAQLQRPTEILTRIFGKVVSFPHIWVTDVLLIPQSQILQLPFYPAAVLGVVHQQGSVVPLVWGQALLRADPSQRYQMSVLPETLTVIRLSAAITNATGVGIVIDQLLGQKSESQNSSQAQHNFIDPNNFVEAHNFVDAPEALKFSLEMLPSHLWQPLRYHA